MFDLRSMGSRRTHQHTEGRRRLGPPMGWARRRRDVLGFGQSTLPLLGERSPYRLRGAGSTPGKQQRRRIIGTNQRSRLSDDDRCCRNTVGKRTTDEPGKTRGSCSQSRVQRMTDGQPGVLGPERVFRPSPTQARVRSRPSQTHSLFGGRPPTPSRNPTGSGLTVRAEGRDWGTRRRQERTPEIARGPEPPPGRLFGSDSPETQDSPLSDDKKPTRGHGATRPPPFDLDGPPSFNQIPQPFRPRPENPRRRKGWGVPSFTTKEV